MTNDSPLIKADLDLNATKDFDLARAAPPYGWVNPEIQGLKIEVKTTPVSGMGGSPLQKAFITAELAGDYDFEMDMVSPVNGAIAHTQRFVLSVENN